MKALTTFIFAVMMTVSSIIAYAQNPTPLYDKGDTAPTFVGTDQFGKPFDLSEQLDKGPVVLMFYRGYWCPHCNKQLSQLEDSLSFITQKGGSVIAVTPEKPDNIEKTIQKTDASFKIIYDQDLSIMNTYGVSYKMEDALIEKYKGYGLNVAQINGMDEPYLPVPATYIIDSSGKILFAFYDPDYSKRATVKQILKNLK
ncbi:hypothetical protein BFP72_17430 [Reichenbachiella sp. 5M10]|uniref:peroxiredoxin-like family protein n=1 Tax=Reichenbachiella sp. 5M10 TaxID=1889772 RepID=UPI000C14A045|nr:peroxiredoxin-like family protein [Reichenbachiella sp. 5M10]PIB37057.1 hypothetical protein BFP72_17430 [Reichenbachiella sp. 5M10]